MTVRGDTSDTELKAAVAEKLRPTVGPLYVHIQNAASHTHGAFAIRKVWLYAPSTRQRQRPSRGPWEWTRWR
jgi:hypothetical protein